MRRRSWLRDRLQLGRDRRLRRHRRHFRAEAAVRLCDLCRRHPGRAVAGCVRAAVADAGLHRALSPLPARHHGTDGSDEPGACRKPRHRPAQGEARGIRDLGADHGACRMALCLSARLCRAGYVRDLLPGDDADRGRAGRPPDLARPPDRHRHADRPAEPAFARRRLEQDHSWLGAGAGPDLLAGRAGRTFSPLRQGIRHRSVHALQ